MAQENEPAFKRTRALHTALFAIYIFLLAWIILWKLEVPWIGDGTLRQIKLVPFIASGDAGASTIRESLGNVALFLPYGIYLALLAPGWKWWKALAVVAGTSIAFEVIQYIFAIGSSDITDVITNTCGGIIGFALMSINKIKRRGRARKVVTRFCSISTAFALVFTIAFVVSPIHYSPKQDHPGISNTSGTGRH